MSQYKLDPSKWKDYNMYFESNNFENILNQVINIASFDNLGYLSDYIYTNANNAWKQPTIKLISILANHKKYDFSSNALVLFYQIKGYIISLNN